MAATISSGKTMVDLTNEHYPKNFQFTSQVITLVSNWNFVSRSKY